MRTLTARSSVMTLSLSMLAVPGCVFWDIRDGVRDANARLDTVDASLQQTNSELRSVQSALTRLDTTNAELVKVQDELGELDATNASLTTVQERLQSLRSIHESLTKMDVHLSSLRKTIGRIDSMIPFLDLGGDEPVSPPDPAGQPAGDPGERAANPTDGSPDNAEPARAPRDALVGAWVRQYPGRSIALVILDSGRYFMQRTADNGARTQGVGEWKREGRVITLTGDPETITRPDGTRETRRSIEHLEIVFQTSRSFSVTSPENGLQVFSKP